MYFLKINIFKIKGVRFVLTDGASHSVDSSELAFKMAVLFAFRDAFKRAKPSILEPIMNVEVTVPVEYQGAVVGDLNRRKGAIQDSMQEREDALIRANVPLNEMFGYSTSIRTMTQGKGEFTMEYSHHSILPQEAQNLLTSQNMKS